MMKKSVFVLAFLLAVALAGCGGTGRQVATANGSGEDQVPARIEAQVKADESQTESPVRETPQAETANTPSVSGDEQGPDVFKLLDGLNYQAMSSDGLPEYTLTAPDGTVYCLNLSSGWVWRRPSLIDGAENEAPLTEAVVDALNESWDALDIVEFGL